MLVNRKGQLGPQGLEDLPMAVMAFIAAVASMIIFLNISSGQLNESRTGDMHDTGKRLFETLSGEAFKSDISRSYGSNVLDGGVLDETHDANRNLTGLLGSIGYAFRAEIGTESKSWLFGPDAPNTTLTYGGSVTLLIDGSLYNGDITVKIWRK